MNCGNLVEAVIVGLVMVSELLAVREALINFNLTHDTLPISQYDNIIVKLLEYHCSSLCYEIVCFIKRFAPDCRTRP